MTIYGQLAILPKNEEAHFMHRLNHAADVVGQDFGQNLQRVGFSLRLASYLFSRSQPLTLSLFLSNLENSWALHSRSVSLSANHGAVQVTVFALR